MSRQLLSRSHSVVSLALVALTAGCGGRYERGSESGSGDVIVIQSNQLHGRPGGLLNELVSRVGALQVRRNAMLRCPEVTFRGVKTFYASTNASVYIDGSPMSDTCILDQIRAAEVTRVEIYPGGHASSPGYRPDPNGLILIFLIGAQP